MQAIAEPGGMRRGGPPFPRGTAKL
jgi:hypothetical protein